MSSETATDKFWEMLAFFFSSTSLIVLRGIGSLGSTQEAEPAGEFSRFQGTSYSNMRFVSLLIPHLL